jgi:hypothetical protein
MKYGRASAFTFFKPGLGAFFRAGTQKPGFPLQFLGITPQFLRYFRFNPLRGRAVWSKSGQLVFNIIAHYPKGPACVFLPKIHLIPNTLIGDSKNLPDYTVCQPAEVKYA